MGRWLDRLFIRSKLKRRSRQMDREAEKRNEAAIDAHRARQAHYREVTESDERGRDTSTTPKGPPEGSSPP